MGRIVLAPLADRLGPAVRLVLATSDRVQEEAGGVPVIRAEQPGRATSYVTDASGRVVFESAGLPPLHLLWGLGRR